MSAAKINRLQTIIHWAIVGVVFLMAASAIIVNAKYQMNPQQTVSLGGTVFLAEVAETPGARERGLGGRESIRDNEAMLFVFDEDGSLPIWMRGMNFPIDIIWLDSNQRVVHIERNVQPDAEPYDTYQSPVPARYVLEVAVGSANISVGSRAQFDIASEGL